MPSVVPEYVEINKNKNGTLKFFKNVSFCINTDVYLFRVTAEQLPLYKGRMKSIQYN